MWSLRPADDAIRLLIEAVGQEVGDPKLAALDLAQPLVRLRHRDRERISVDPEKATLPSVHRRTPPR
jgi:hypothetical protein